MVCLLESILRDMPTKTEVTMIVVDNDTGLFTPLESLKCSKNIMLNFIMELICVKNFHDVIFVMPRKSSTRFNVNLSSKNLFSAIQCHLYKWLIKLCILLMIPLFSRKKYSSWLCKRQNGECNVDGNGV